MEFETERLEVGRIGVADAGFVLALLNDPGFLANIGDRGVRTIEQARAYVRERMLAAYADGVGMLRVARRADGAAIGLVGLVRRAGLPAPDLGFAFLAAHVGQGYGFEAASGFLRHAPAPRPLLAITAPDNQASAALLGKLGFVEQAPVRLPDAARDSRLFRLA